MAQTKPVIRTGESQQDFERRVALFPDDDGTHNTPVIQPGESQAAFQERVARFQEERVSRNEPVIRQGESRAAFNVRVGRFRDAEATRSKPTMLPGESQDAFEKRAARIRDDDAPGDPKHTATTSSGVQLYRSSVSGNITLTKGDASITLSRSDFDELVAAYSRQNIERQN